MKKAKFLSVIVNNDEICFNCVRYFVQPWYFKTGDVVSVSNTPCGNLSVFNADGTKLICYSVFARSGPYVPVESLIAPLSHRNAMVIRI